MARNKTIQEIFREGRPDAEIIEELKCKSEPVPAWSALEKEYNPRKHPVMQKSLYPDIVEEDGTITHVTRVAMDMQRLAAKRMTELAVGIPVKRIYKPDNKEEEDVAKILEEVFIRNRIDSVNIERCNMLYAGCEFATVWYAVEQKTSIYGFDSPVKLRCKNYSPMLGDIIYPLKNTDDDLIALSFQTKRKEGRKTIEFFDTFTAEKHIQWQTVSGICTRTEDEVHQVGKIPGIYVMRPAPIWEESSDIVYEIEWALSRNGNYLRANSAPVFCIFADEEIPIGESPKNAPKKVYQFPKGSDAKFVSWEQAIDNLKFYVTELRQSFYTQLQLPEMSYENMKTTPMSGEARKMMFVDAQLKVKEESGRLIEGFLREVNVVKAFLRPFLPETLTKAMDNLQVDVVITPFTIYDEKEKIDNILSATGNKAIASQLEGIKRLGWSSDPQKTLQEIQEQEMNNAMDNGYAR